MLRGDLGAGKTEFVRGLASALCTDVPVRSPSFAIVNEYPCEPRIYHADLYRVSSRDEFEELDLLDESSDGVLVVEWPERAGGGLDEYDIEVWISRPDPYDDLRIIGLDSPDPGLSGIISTLE